MPPSPPHGRPPARRLRRATPDLTRPPIIGTTEVYLLTGIREKALAGPEELIPGARFRLGRVWRWRRVIVEKWLSGEVAK